MLWRKIQFLKVGQNSLGTKSQMELVHFYFSLGGQTNLNYHCHTVFYHKNAENKQSVKTIAGEVLDYLLIKSFENKV